MKNKSNNNTNVNNINYNSKNNDISYNNDNNINITTNNNNYSNNNSNDDNNGTKDKSNNSKHDNHHISMIEIDQDDPEIIFLSSSNDKILGINQRQTTENYLNTNRKRKSSSYINNTAVKRINNEEREIQFDIDEEKSCHAFSNDKSVDEDFLDCNYNQNYIDDNYHSTCNNDRIGNDDNYYHSNNNNNNNTRNTNRSNRNNEISAYNNRIEMIEDSDKDHDNYDFMNDNNDEFHNDYNNVKNNDNNNDNNSYYNNCSNNNDNNNYNNNNTNKNNDNGTRNNTNYDNMNYSYNHIKLYNTQSCNLQRESYLILKPLSNNISFTLIVDVRERVVQANYQEFSRMIKSRILRYADKCSATDSSIPIGDFMWILEDDKSDKVCTRISSFIFSFIILKENVHQLLFFF